jgi:tetratricopeptide (TPR) repeat protein
MSKTPSLPSGGGTDVRPWLEQALGLHRQGRFLEAQQLYQRILALEPRHFDALHLSGALAAQMKQPALAVALIEKAISIDGQHAFAHSNLGSAQVELGRHEEALASFRRAIALNDRFAQAHLNLGELLSKLQRSDEALASFAKVIELDPQNWLAHYHRGNVFQQLARYPEALESFDKVIKLDATHAAAHYNRGNALLKLTRTDEAIASYEKALALDPRHAHAHYNRGNALLDLKKPELAAASFEQAIAMDPDYADAHANLGATRLKLKQHDKARACFERAIELKPDFAQAHLNLGSTLIKLKQAHEAVKCFEKAIELHPDDLEAYANCGNALQELKRFDEAFACYDQAIALQPDHAGAHWGKALTLLLTEDFANGWRLFEWRWKIEDSLKMGLRHYRQALWLGGESLQGKTIFLYPEQGLGDIIQFCRYVKWVKQLGAQVVLEVPAPLVRLLQGLDGVDRLVVSGMPLPDFDVQCPLMSLPLAFNTRIDSIPGPQAYLKASQAQVESWKQRLGPPQMPRIGLAWSGNPQHDNDLNRSLALSELVAHLPPGFEYHSLQKEIRDADASALDAAGIRRHEQALLDFSETAALCQLMDVVISVDTSVAHLAAALGRPTWLLLPYSPDWRWLLDRDDSPWYASMRLYRQSSDRQYAPVLQRVAQDLMKLPTFLKTGSKSGKSKTRNSQHVKTSRSKKS